MDNSIERGLSAGDAPAFIIATSLQRGERDARGFGKELQSGKIWSKSGYSTCLAPI